MIRHNIFHRQNLAQRDLLNFETRQEIDEARKRDERFFAQAYIDEEESRVPVL